MVCVIEKGERGERGMGCNVGDHRSQLSPSRIKLWLCGKHLYAVGCPNRPCLTFNT